MAFRNDDVASRARVEVLARENAALRDGLSTPAQGRASGHFARRARFAEGRGGLGDREGDRL